MGMHLHAKGLVRTGGGNVNKIFSYMCNLQIDQFSPEIKPYIGN